MNNKKFYLLIVALLILGSCSLYFKGHFLKILHPNEYYLSCTDFGQYIIEVKEYLREDKNYLELLKVGEDPGFFMIISNLLKIANIPVQSILTLSSIFMYCLNGLCIFLLSLQNSKKNNYVAGVISILLYISLYGTIESYISGIWRQIMGTFFFLIFLFSRKYPNSNGYLIVGIASAVMSILTHRIFLVFCSATLLFVSVQSFFLDKKMYKKNVYFFIICILLVLPYFILFFGYMLHLYEYGQSLKLSGEQMIGDFTIQQQSSKYLGWSFYGPRDDRTALMHYLFYQSYVLIACLAFCRKTLKKMHTIYISSLIFLFIYISFRLDFSVRILLVFEIIAIPLAAKNLFFNYSKRFSFFLIIGIFSLGFIFLSQGLIKRIAEKPFDPSVNFLLSHIDKNQKHYFFTNNTCGADLLGQLGFTNFFNFQMPLYGMREMKANNIPDVAELQGMTSRAVVFFKRSNTTFDYFKDKGRLFIIFTKSDKKEVNLIKAGASDLLGKEYLELIYPQDYSKPGSGIIQYIFEVDPAKLKYADSKYYIKTNIQNFGLE